LNVPRPKREGIPDFLFIAMPLVNSGYASESPGAVVQRQLDNVRRDTKALKSTRERSSQVAHVHGRIAGETFSFAEL
jgi:hypothetical protein